MHQPTARTPAAARAIPVRGASTGLAVGAAVVGAALAVAWAAGLLPPPRLRFAATGAAAALLAGAAAIVLQLRVLRSADAARLPAMQVQLALGLGLVFKLAGLALGAAILLAAGVKFAGIAAFAVSFAAAALVLQVCSAAVCARALARTADPARTDPSP